MKYFKFSDKFISMILATAVILCACSGCGMIDEAADLLGLSMSEVDGEEVEESILNETPVIVIESPKEAIVEEEQAETVEEPVYEYVWDDENKIYSMEAANPDQVVFRFVGDINFCDDYANMRAFHERGDDITQCVLPAVIEQMQAADVMIANNEFAYSDRGAPTGGKQYTFRAKPERVKLMEALSVDVVSLANNHAYDWGPDALCDTIDLLKEEKIPFAGAGKNLAEAMTPVYLKINGKTFAFVSATQIERTANPDTKEATETEPGVLRTLDPGKFVSVIETAEQNSDFTIVYVHWGSESTDLVEDSQRELAKKYVKAGADLIIGDHSHCLQGADYIDGVPVFYSLGNFWFNSKTLDTCIVSVTVDTSSSGEPTMTVGGVENYADTLPMSEIKFISCIQQGCKTRLADTEETARILTYLRGISNHACFSDEGIMDYIAEDQNTQGGMNTFPGRKVESETTAEPSADVPAATPESEALAESGTDSAAEE